MKGCWDAHGIGRKHVKLDWERGRIPDGLGI